MTLDVPLDFRDLQSGDLDRLGWSGGPVHLAILDACLARTWEGDGAVMVGEVPTGAIVAVGCLDWTREPGTGWISQLAVRPSWRSLGVGTLLIRALEDAAAAAGADRTGLAVEQDNPRAAGLYRRLGYRPVSSITEVWPTEGGTERVCVSTRMEKVLSPVAGE